MIVRQVRVLIYEGPSDWVESCMTNKNNWVQGQRIVDINVETKEIRKCITEHIAPAVVVLPGDTVHG